MCGIKFPNIWSRKKFRKVVFVKYNITKRIVIVIAKSWKLIDRKCSKAET